MQPVKVDIECLEWEEDLLYFNGNPFMGIVCMKFPDGTYIERSSKEGLPHGTVREWDSEGRLRGEGTCKNGRSHGRFTRWHPDGTIQYIAVYEHGLLVDYTEWDLEGEVSEKWTRPSDDPLRLKLRKWYGEDSESTKNLFMNEEENEA